MHPRALQYVKQWHVLAAWSKTFCAITIENCMQLASNMYFRVTTAYLQIQMVKSRVSP